MKVGGHVSWNVFASMLIIVEQSPVDSERIPLLNWTVPEGIEHRACRLFSEPFNQVLD